MVRSISRAWGFLGAVAVAGSWSAFAQNPSAIPDLSGVWADVYADPGDHAGGTYILVKDITWSKQ